MDESLLDCTWYELQKENNIEISTDGGKSWKDMDLNCMIRTKEKPPAVWYARMWLGDHGEGEYEVSVAEATVDNYLTYEVPEEAFYWNGKFVCWVGDWCKVEV